MQLKDLTAIHSILAGETPISQRWQNKILMSPHSHNFLQPCHQPVFQNCVHVQKVWASPSSVIPATKSKCEEDGAICLQSLPKHMNFSFFKSTYTFINNSNIQNLHM